MATRSVERRNRRVQTALHKTKTNRLLTFPKPAFLAPEGEDYRARYQR